MYFPLLAWIDRVACIHSVAQSIAKKKGPLRKIPNVTSKLWSRLRATAKWLLHLSPPLSKQAGRKRNRALALLFPPSTFPLPANRFQLWSAPNRLLVRFLWLTFPSWCLARFVIYLTEYLSGSTLLRSRPSGPEDPWAHFEQIVLNILTPNYFSSSL